VLGQPCFGVEREQPQDHLQAAAGNVGAGSFRVGVQVGGQDLRWYGAERRLGAFQCDGSGVDPAVYSWQGGVLLRWGPLTVEPLRQSPFCGDASAAAAATALRAAVRAGLVTFRVSGPMSMP
jgi:hypothetical protein